MSVDTTSGAFTPDEIETNDFTEVELRLSNIERGQLRELAAPGLPLWKLLRYFHAYATAQAHSIMEVDFIALPASQSAEIAGRKQSLARSATWAYNELKSAMDIVSEAKTETEDNG